MNQSEIRSRFSKAIGSASFRFRLLVTTVILAALAAPVSGADAATQIKNEVDRLQQSIKEKPIVIPDIPNAASYITDPLKVAAAAEAAGMTYISLESLGRAEDLLQGFRTMAEKSDAVKSGLPAYEALWNQASLNLTALDRQARERDWTNSRAAIRALAEAAQGRAIPLLEGGRGFAAATQPKDGLLYMGQAQGETEFSAFCASLKITRKGSAYPLRSYLPELAALQKKTNDAFQPPRSIDLHPRFIALNSTLKLAQELDSSKFYAGAFYQYLEAVRHYGMLDVKPPDAAQQAELRKAVAAARKKFDASQRDDSIALMFLERAETQTVHADGTSPSEDEWKSAKIIVEQVLPAYETAALPPPALAKSSGKTVNLALVRWPYT